MAACALANADAWRLRSLAFSRCVRLDCFLCRMCHASFLYTYFCMSTAAAKARSLLLLAAVDARTEILGSARMQSLKVLHALSLESGWHWRQFSV